MKDNPTLKKLFAADQEARHLAPSDPAEFNSYWPAVAKQDEKRRKQVKLIEKAGRIKTATDYHHAAMIFQHGQDKEDHQQAKDFAKIAMDLGNEDAKWLYAAATDRLLRTLGKKQKFGTQYEWVVLKEGEKYYDAMLIDPYNKSTTDTTRARYNVPTLAQLKARQRKVRRKH